MDDKKLLELWDAPVTICEIREEMGISLEQLRLAVRRLKLPRRYFSDESPMTPAQMREWDEKIAVRKLEVQARWTPSEEWQRRVTKVTRDYEVPTVHY
jgi:hypothetical protein